MSTLAMTRVTSGATISSTTENNNQSAIEAVVNGGIEAANIADDAVTAAKVNSDVVNAGGGLKQETNGSLSVDPSDTNPCVEITDGGLRVKVDDSSIERATGGLQIKAGGIVNAMMAVSPQLPVGSVYINTVNPTNPATLLGYGTWVAIEGVVLAGYKSGDPNFGTIGATIGAATHTLSVAEVPALTITPTMGDTDAVGPGPYFDSSSNNNGTISVQTNGGGGAHNNIQPTRIVYAWERTA